MASPMLAIFGAHVKMASSPPPEHLHVTKPRYLTPAIAELALDAGKIALLSGPRQCGKTTLARAILESSPSGGTYLNWDDVTFRRIWTKSPKAVLPQAGSGPPPVLVLDEIHKDRTWKARLKGLYDTLDHPCRIVVTGSARLNVYRKGGDSLLGRYFHFRLHPFSLREMREARIPSPSGALEQLFVEAKSPSSEDEEAVEHMLRFGPFPEPLLAQDERRARLWRRTRTELLIREDLRDISRIPDLGRVEMLASLLPERVGSLFGMNALREELEVSYDTVKRWVNYLKELYYLFELKPHATRIPRSLKKEGKVYLFDFAEVEDEAARFENLIAFHLLKACDAWTDTGEGEFELRYLRNKDQQEIDFLILKDGKPWLPVEVKLHDTKPARTWKRFSALLPCRRAIQVVRKPHRQIHEYPNATLLVVGAAEFLSQLV